MSVRHMGKGIEDTLREELEEQLKDDPETLNLALQLLDVYVHEGRRGVRRLIARLAEADDFEGENPKA